MTSSQAERIARRMVAFENRQAARRAAQLPSSSLPMNDGTEIRLGDAAESAKDAAAGVGVLDEQVADVGSNTDLSAELGSTVPDMIVPAVDGADISFETALRAITRATEALAGANEAAVEAAAATETALGNARYRQVDGEPGPTPPEGGFRVGSELTHVDENGHPYKVDVWNGTAWAPNRLLLDQVLVLSPEGTVQIENGTLTAPTIIGGDLIGNTMTGALVRTAEDGQRVQLDSTGLRTFNSENTETSRLTAAAGGLRVGLAGGGNATIGEVATIPGRYYIDVNHSGGNYAGMFAASNWARVYGRGSASKSFVLTAGTGGGDDTELALYNGSHSLAVGVNDSGESVIEASGASPLRIKAPRITLDGWAVLPNGENNMPISAVSGITKITAASGTSVQAVTEVVRDNHGYVNYNIVAQRTAWTAGGTTTLGNVPEGFRPPATVTVPAVVYGAGTPFLTFAQISAAGAVLLYNSPTNGQSWTAAIVGMYKAAAA